MGEIRRQADVLKAPDGRHRADRGLFLEVRGGGAYRSWIWIYEVNGKRHVKGLGSARLVTLSQARDAVIRYRAMILSGEGVADRRPRTVPTMGEALSLAVEQRKSSSMWRESTQEKWGGVIRLHIPDSLKGRLVDEVTRADLLAVLSPLWQESPRTGEATRQMLSLAFTYAVREGWVDSNPAAWRGCLEFDLPHPDKAAPVSHRAAMDLAGVRRLIPLFASQSVVHKAVVFGTLTAARAGEFSAARWVEIDWQAQTWSVPPERRKDGKPEPFVVPLSKQASGLLDSLERKSDWLFASRGSHISRSSPASILRRTAGTTMHGMRSVFRSWCANEGISFEVAESCLMHAVGSKVSRSYQRSNLLASRREVLQRWADTILPM